MTTSRDAPLPDCTGRAVGLRPRATQAKPTRPKPTSSRLAVAWAITHPAESIEEAATIHLRSFGDTAIPVAGPGAPLVAEFSIAEYAAAIGLPTEAGKRYLGHALELRYRLPQPLETRHRRRPGRLESPPHRRPDHCTSRWRPPGTSTDTSPPSPTRSAPARSTGSSTKPSPGTCPKRPKNAAAPPGTNATSPSTTTPPTSPAPASSPARSTSPTPSTSTEPSRAEAQRMADLGNTDTLDHRRATALGTIARRDLTLDYPTTHHHHQPAHRPAPTDQPTGQPATAATRSPPADRSCSTCTCPRPPSAFQPPSGP